MVAALLLALPQLTSICGESGDGSDTPGEGSPPGERKFIPEAPGVDAVDADPKSKLSRSWPGLLEEDPEHFFK